MSTITDTNTDGSRTAVLGATARRLIRRPWSVWSLLKRAEVGLAVDLARGKPFAEANRKRMNKRVQTEGDGAIGGTDLGIGDLQFETLRQEGLESNDRLLDIGCGTLRGGQHFVEYLDHGKYVGLDISDEALRAGKERLGEETLFRKAPTLRQNDDLRFEEVDEPVEYALAQSVWTHIPPEDVAECLEHIGGVLTDGGALYATHHAPDGDDDVEIIGPASFRYSESRLRELAAEYDLRCEQIRYPHPAGQRMLRFSEE